MALTTNLQAYYKLDGNSTDSAGSNNGTDTNITYNTSNGKINQGAGFDGSTSLISIGNAAGLNSASFTYTAWIKPTSFTNTNYIVSTAVAGAPSWRIDSSVATQNLSKAGIINIGSSNTALTANVFSFVAVTYDGTTATFYLNGVADGTPSSAQTFLTEVRQIGVFTTPSSVTDFSGAIDEVGIWSRVLTGAEITQLYNHGAGLQYPFASSGLLVFM